MIRKHGEAVPALASVDPDGPVHIAMTLTGTPGDDHLEGAGKADFIDASQGGDDVVDGRGGNDQIYFGAAFTGADRVDGGGDNGGGGDVVTLDGDYSAGIEVQADSLYQIEQLVLLGGSYVITGDLGYKDRDGGATIVDARALTAGETLDLNVQAAGSLHVYGGAGDDVIHGAANGLVGSLAGNGGNDTLIAGSGGTGMVGGAGSDTIIMSNSADVAVYGPDDVHAHKWVDTIENFASSSGRVILNFDSDETTPGLQFDFHLGKTAGRVGDIRSHYDASADETIVKVFTNADHKADLVIHLTGDVHLTTSDFIFG